MKAHSAGKMLGWLGLGLLTFIILAPVQTESLSYRQSCFMDFAHMPFAVVFSAVVFYLVCGPRGRRFPPWPVAAILMGVFLVSEWVQPYFNRSFSWLDMYYDILGVFGGWILFAAHRERVTSILWGLAVLVVLAGLPLGIQLFRLCRLESRFPELSAFVLPDEEPHWSLVNCEFHQLDEPGEGRWVLKVLQDGDAAFFIEHPIQDWTGFSHLMLEFSVPAAVEATLRIDDRTATQNYFDRFQNEFITQAGINQTCQPFQGAQISSGKRALEWSTIHRLGLILPGMKAGDIISLKTLVLRREGCY